MASWKDDEKIFKIFLWVNTSLYNSYMRNEPISKKQIGSSIVRVVLIFINCYFPYCSFIIDQVLHFYLPNCLRSNSFLAFGVPLTISLRTLWLC